MRGPVGTVVELAAVVTTENIINQSKTRNSCPCFHGALMCDCLVFLPLLRQKYCQYVLKLSEYEERVYRVFLIDIILVDNCGP